MPRVSVVIPTHNRPALLDAAQASVQAQTFADWEAIIVDDASTPPVGSIFGDVRFRVLRHHFPQGGAAAKNTGVDGAVGEILAFLDDDDLYAPQFLQRALEILDRHHDLDVVFMGVRFFGASGSWGQCSYDDAMSKCLAEAHGNVTEPGVITFDNGLVDALFRSVPMAFQRPVVRTDAMRRIGLYRPNCLLWDSDWALSAALNARTALLVEGLYLQRVDGQGTSSRADRRLDHLNSAIEIKERFWQEARLGRYPRHRIAKFRNGAAQAWFDLAWHHYQRHDRRKALAALWRSELLEFSIPHLKLLARLMVSGK